VLIAATTIVLELGARVALFAVDHWRTDPRVAADGYKGADWTRAYYREFVDSGGVDWHSFVYWRRRPFTGTFINIDARGLRRTWRPAELPARHMRVFVFGGSPVWGTGVRDEYTVPSLLAKDAHASGGAPVEFVNYGESGYVTRQAIDTLVSELVAGRIPDVVVFQSGVEDTFSALQNGQAGLPQNEGNRREEFNLLQPDRLAAQSRMLVRGLELLGSHVRGRFVGQAASAAGATPALASDVAANYCSNIGVVAALGDRYGFRSVFFWQPVLFLKRQQTAYERSAAAQYGYAAQFFAEVYQHRASHECPGVNVHDLGPVTDEERAPMFIDAFHPTEEGNQRLAAAMWPAIAAAAGHDGATDRQ